MSEHFQLQTKKSRYQQSSQQNICDKLSHGTHRRQPSRIPHRISFYFPFIVHFYLSFSSPCFPLFHCSHTRIFCSIISPSFFLSLLGYHSSELFYLQNSLSFIIRLIHFIDHPFITIPPIYHIIALPYHIIAPPSHHITTPPTRPGRRVRCACGPRDGRRGHGGDTQLQSVPLHAPGRTETAGGGGRGVCVNEGRTFLTRSLHSFVRLFAWLAG